MSNQEWAEFREQVKGLAKSAPSSARRELRAASKKIERLSADSDAGARAAHLDGYRRGLEEGSGELAGDVEGSFQEVKRATLLRFERAYFVALASECGGNISEMARRADMERAHVRMYVRRLGIDAGGAASYASRPKPDRAARPPAATRRRAARSIRPLAPRHHVEMAPATPEPAGDPAPPDTSADPGAPA